MKIHLASYIHHRKRKTVELKNIIFDYGKVIINLDFDLTRIAFEKEGVNNFNSMLTEFSHQPFFHLFDCGLISEEEFRMHLRTATGLPLSDGAIDNCWNAMLLDIPKDRMKYIEGIKNKFNTFLLSNTNSIHLNFISNYLQKEFGIKDISEKFKNAYYSCQVGMRKPDEKIFQLVLEENNLVPEETLFLDDSAVNVETADKLGMHVILIMPGDEIEIKIKEFIASQKEVSLH
ncbi:MAG: HAD family phosphatase [Sphingobacteriales bacterium]|nr:MAG: HAD family phosphatase [Sphingobacteriales bacterium]